MSREIPEIKVIDLTHIHTHKRRNNRDCFAILSIAGIMKLPVEHIKLF